MLDIVLTAKFRKDLQRIKKRGSKQYNSDLLWSTVRKIAQRETLDPSFRDHPLKGNYEGYRECHLNSDWLLVYKIKNEQLVLVLSRTGTHSDLF